MTDPASPAAPLPAIDSHCHLADKAFTGDLSEVVRRARATGAQRSERRERTSKQREPRTEAGLRGHEIACWLPPWTRGLMKEGSKERE